MAMPAAASQEACGDVAAAIAALRPRFGERLQTGAEIRRHHANGQNVDLLLRWNC